MEFSELIGRFLFIAPVVAVPALLAILRFTWRMSIFLLLAGTFVQVTCGFGIELRSVGVQNLPWIILFFYSFALYPFGLWSAIVGVIGWALAVRMRWPLGLPKRRQYLLGA